MERRNQPVLYHPNVTLDVLTELKKANIFLERMTVASKHSTGRIRIVCKAFRKNQIESVMNSIKNITGVHEVVKQ